MKKAFILVLSLLYLYCCLNSCKNKSTTIENNERQTVIKNEEIINSEFLTAEKQSELTPQKILEVLKAGNKDYTEDNLTVRNTSFRIREASLGQYPGAVVLSCLDSRVPVEDVFHCGIGDLFVARVAGNIVNEDILGSLEYACKVSGAKAIVVLGHEHCGAIKSAIDNVELGNITALLSKIKPSVNSLNDFKEEKTSKNQQFVEAVCHQNVKKAIEDIRTLSPILKEMEQKGEIVIVGAEYHMETGKVDFFQ
ncbi:carbonic anhydrase family protein [Solitalea koreensis]|uniref:Carbonic anhydrase n=1 Tax=Solitalea koreensis TaxID=543615 RepID=A0A521D1D9_9SPHI|nr:carbonic anhydrase family protein [Solitalea koreensis]SMO65509.1 carbonic anhydrase [Solitalea koreensis]